MFSDKDFFLLFALSVLVAVGIVFFQNSASIKEKNRVSEKKDAARKNGGAPESAKLNSSLKESEEGGGGGQSSPKGLVVPPPLVEKIEAIAPSEGANRRTMF